MHLPRSPASVTWQQTLRTCVPDVENVLGRIFVKPVPEGMLDTCVRSQGVTPKTPPPVNGTLFGFGTDFGGSPGWNNGLTMDTSVRLFSSGRFHTLWSNSSGNVYSLGCSINTYDVIL
jgi:hypothetical protein